MTISQQFMADTARPLIVHAPKAQRVAIDGADEVTVMHASVVADLLAASPGKLFLACWLIGAGLALGAAVPVGVVLIAGLFR